MKNTNTKKEVKLFQWALWMSGIFVNIPTADLILCVFKKANKLKGKFSIMHGAIIEAGIEKKYNLKKQPTRKTKVSCQSTSGTEKLRKK